MCRHTQGVPTLNTHSCEPTLRCVCLHTCAHTGTHMHPRVCTRTDICTHACRQTKGRTSQEVCATNRTVHLGAHGGEASRLRDWVTATWSGSRRPASRRTEPRRTGSQPSLGARALVGCVLAHPRCFLAFGQEPCMFRSPRAPPTTRSLLLLQKGKREVSRAFLPADPGVLCSWEGSPPTPEESQCVHV